jgi:hypothetical protein
LLDPDKGLNGYTDHQEHCNQYGFSSFSSPPPSPAYSKPCHPGHLLP